MTLNIKKKIVGNQYQQKLKEIEKLKFDYENLKNECTDLKAELQNLHDIFINNTYESTNGESYNFEKYMNNIKVRAEENVKIIHEQYDELYIENEDEEPELKTEIIDSHYNNVKLTSKQSQNILDALRKKVYGYIEYTNQNGESYAKYSDDESQLPKDCTINDKQLGIITECENSKQEIDEFYTNTQMKKNELFKEIESLLPGATVTGLATAFYESKKEYSLLFIDADKEKNTQKKPHWFTTTILWIWHYIKVLIMYGVFIVPLGFVVYFNHEFLLGAKNIDMTTLLSRIILNLPLAFISLFGWYTIHSRKKIYAEYNHKQRLMQLYVGLYRSLDENGMDAEKQQLTNAIVKNISKEPAIIREKMGFGLVGMFNKKDNLKDTAVAETGIDNDR